MLPKYVLLLVDACYTKEMGRLVAFGELSIDDTSRCFCCELYKDISERERVHRADGQASVKHVSMFSNRLNM